MTITDAQREAIAEGLFAAFNLPERQSRHAALGAIIAEDLVYLDPHQPDQPTGRKGYLELSDRFHELMTGYRLMLGSVDGHHNALRFGSILLDKDGNLFSRGQFFALINTNREIATLAAFGA